MAAVSVASGRQRFCSQVAGLTGMGCNNYAQEKYNDPHKVEDRKKQLQQNLQARFRNDVGPKERRASEPEL